jgi:GTP cyclohydrolase I
MIHDLKRQSHFKYNRLKMSLAAKSEISRANKMMNLPELVKDILVTVGEDPHREGLVRTPQRVAKSLRELTSGYGVDLDKLINDALFEVPYSEMVLVRDIDFYSLCEHHLLPFFGKCHVAYIPDGRVIGLSKIPRIVEAFSRRLQVQERLTSQIAEVLLKKVKPLGVAVVMEARHLCMEMRGAQSKNSPTVTSAMVGVFRSDARTREEFLGFINSTKH